MSEDQQARLRVLKQEYAALGVHLKRILAEMPIPVGFQLGDNVEHTAESLAHMAEILAEMPVPMAVAEAMKSALMLFVSATYALTWFAVHDGDWAYMNVRFLLLESGKALRTAVLGLLATGEDGEVQG